VIFSPRKQSQRKQSIMKTNRVNAGIRDQFRLNTFPPAGSTSTPPPPPAPTTK
jgi:hypothetical protein